MLQVFDPQSVDLTKLILAVGGLGTAAYGLVDITKTFDGGVSNRGFSDIKKVFSKLVPVASQEIDKTAALALQPALDTLRANWINGMALADQKAVAKALIKLNLKPDTAGGMATATGVNPALLGQVAGKLGTAQQLEATEADVFGRFDLALSSLLDQGYQRADQRYRNSAKLLAVVFSIVLALVGVTTVFGLNAGVRHYVLGFVAGLLATPLAPVAKDLSSAIQAGAKVAQSFKK